MGSHKGDKSKQQKLNQLQGAKKKKVPQKNLKDQKNINESISGESDSDYSDSESDIINPTGEVLYEVEAIRNHKGVGKKREYFIKWLGYPESQNTWEPLDNLQNILYMINQYEEKLKGGSSSSSSSQSKKSIKIKVKEPEPEPESEKKINRKRKAGNTIEQVAEQAKKEKDSDDEQLSIHVKRQKSKKAIQIDEDQVNSSIEESKEISISSQKKKASVKEGSLKLIQSDSQPSHSISAFLSQIKNEAKPGKTDSNLQLKKSNSSNQEAPEKQSKKLKILPNDSQVSNNQKQQLTNEVIQNKIVQGTNNSLKALNKLTSSFLAEKEQQIQEQNNIPSQLLVISSSAGQEKNLKNFLTQFNKQDIQSNPQIKNGEKLQKLLEVSAKPDPVDQQTIQIIPPHIEKLNQENQDLLQLLKIEQEQFKKVLNTNDLVTDSEDDYSDNENNDQGSATKNKENIKNEKIFDLQKDLEIYKNCSIDYVKTQKKEIENKLSQELLNKITLTLSESLYIMNVNDIFQNTVSIDHSLYEDKLSFKPQNVKNSNEKGISPSISQAVNQQMEQEQDVESDLTQSEQQGNLQSNNILNDKQTISTEKQQLEEIKYFPLKQIENQDESNSLSSVEQVTQIDAEYEIMNIKQYQDSQQHNLILAPTMQEMIKDKSTDLIPEKILSTRQEYESESEEIISIEYDDDDINKEDDDINKSKQNNSIINCPIQETYITEEKNDPPSNIIEENEQDQNQKQQNEKDFKEDEIKKHIQNQESDHIESKIYDKDDLSNEESVEIDIMEETVSEQQIQNPIQNDDEESEQQILVEDDLSEEERLQLLKDSQLNVSSIQSQKEISNSPSKDISPSQTINQSNDELIKQNNIGTELDNSNQQIKQIEFSQINTQTTQKQSTDILKDKNIKPYVPLLAIIPEEQEYNPENVFTEMNQYKMKEINSIAENKEVDQNFTKSNSISSNTNYNAFQKIVSTINPKEPNQSIESRDLITLDQMIENQIYDQKSNIQKNVDLNIVEPQKFNKIELYNPPSLQKLDSSNLVIEKEKSSSQSSIPEVQSLQSRQNSNQSIQSEKLNQIEKNRENQTPKSLTQNSNTLNLSKTESNNSTVIQLDKQISQQDMSKQQQGKQDRTSLKEKSKKNEKSENKSRRRSRSRSSLWKKRDEKRHSKSKRNSQKRSSSSSKGNFRSDSSSSKQSYSSSSSSSRSSSSRKYHKNRDKKHEKKFNSKKSSSKRRGSSSLSSSSSSSLSSSVSRSSSSSCTRDPKKQALLQKKSSLPDEVIKKNQIRFQKFKQSSHQTSSSLSLSDSDERIINRINSLHKDSSPQNGNVIFNKNSISKHIYQNQDKLELKGDQILSQNISNQQKGKISIRISRNQQFQFLSKKLVIDQVPKDQQDKSHLQRFYSNQDNRQSINSSIQKDKNESGSPHSFPLIPEKQNLQRGQSDQSFNNPLSKPTQIESQQKLNNKDQNRNSLNQPSQIIQFQVNPSTPQATLQPIKQDKKIKTIKPKNPFGARTMYDSDESSSSSNDSENDSDSDIQKKVNKSIPLTQPNLPQTQQLKSNQINQQIPTKTPSLELRKNNSSIQPPPGPPPPPLNIELIINRFEPKVNESLKIQPPQFESTPTGNNQKFLNQTNNNPYQRQQSNQEKLTLNESYKLNHQDSLKLSKQDQIKSSFPILPQPTIESNSMNLKQIVNMIKEDSIIKQSQKQENNSSIQVEINDQQSQLKRISVSQQAPQMLQHPQTPIQASQQNIENIKDPRLKRRMQDQAQKLTNLDQKFQLLKNSTSFLSNIGCIKFDEPEQILCHIYHNGQLFFKVSWKPRRIDKVQMPPTFIEYFKVQEVYPLIFNKYMLTLLSSNKIRF